MSHHVGHLAELIAQEVEIEPLPSIYYLCGLFHNIGSLVLSVNYKDFNTLYQQHKMNPITWPLIEKQYYGVRHNTIGVLLAKHWGLPNHVCEAIYLHHAILPTFDHLIQRKTVTMSAILQYAIYLFDKFALNLNVDESIENNILYDTLKKELMVSDDVIDILEFDAKNIAL